MLDIGEGNEPDSRCFYSKVTLPRAIDDHQPPTKHKPFFSVLGIPFTHTIEVLGPANKIQDVHPVLQKVVGPLQYAKVYMRLKELITGDFFNTYIKSGNVAMLSEGRVGINNTFSLRDGILHLNIDRPTYERAGLVGKPIESPGRKHAKARYVIEINLRLPTMVRGKSGFNRIMYAFENVLVERLTWLFYDLRDERLSAPSTTATKDATTESLDGAEAAEAASSETSNASAPIHDLQPKLRHMTTDQATLGQLITPSFPTSLTDKDKIEATEWLEWLNLALLQCPRLSKDDMMDSTLSRYSVPDIQPTDEQADRDAKSDTADSEEFSGTDAVDMAKLSISGFMPANLAAKIVTKCIKQVGDGSRAWLAIRVRSFDGRHVVIFVRDGKAHIWEYK